VCGRVVRARVSLLADFLSTIKQQTETDREATPDACHTLAFVFIPAAVFFFFEESPRKKKKRRGSACPAHVFDALLLLLKPEFASLALFFASE
jgi:hypothetical protein